jgi:hypothetical protein
VADRHCILQDAGQTCQGHHPPPALTAGMLPVSLATFWLGVLFELQRCHLFPHRRQSFDKQVSSWPVAVGMAARRHGRYVTVQGNLSLWVFAIKLLTFQQQAQSSSSQQTLAESVPVQGTSYASTLSQPRSSDTTWLTAMSIHIHVWSHAED